MVHLTEHGRKYEQLRNDLREARKSGNKEVTRQAEAAYDEFMAPFEKKRSAGYSSPPDIESLEERIRSVEERLERLESSLPPHRPLGTVKG